jgi:phosphoglycerol transferase MdoB-like AlkP superfamily enzyme
MFFTFLPYILIFLVTQLVVRLTLCWRVLQDIPLSMVELAQIFLRGFWFDSITLGFAMLPIALAMVLIPESRLARMMGRFLFCVIMIFTAISEYIFWTEFAARFNFIAVDYLVYTHEVIENIFESYPVMPIFTGIGMAAALLTWFSLKRFPLRAYQPWRKRAMATCMVAVATFAMYSAGDSEQAQIKDDTAASELAGNGYYNLFYAFWHNEIDYNRFYATQSHQKVADTLRSLLTEENMQFVSEAHDDLRRTITATGPEKKLNIMLVVMESMSAEYMGVFGNQNGLTASLDKLAQKGLFFTNTYATGTRTVRGLEAITLSIPPTPGQSIIRRPHNENLFSIGSVLRDKGYDTRFIYGGYGYFDNMNAFYAGNGFEVVDRTDIPDEKVHFGNVWGICDEDLFDASMHQADISYQAGKPFLNLMMTTSNHRPYTYPEGRIDIASKTGRLGGVKYADYSIGRFIRQAKRKPWFDDTVFVFVADHTAGAGGKMDFDANRYHIPMIFYAPKYIKPKKFTHVASQIDVVPILLGMMNMSYTTKFYGEDLLHDEDEISHAFISTYQKVGLIKEETLTVLEPRKHITQYRWPALTATQDKTDVLIDEAIGYYQSASWWKKSYRAE